MRTSNRCTLRQAQGTVNLSQEGSVTDDRQIIDLLSSRSEQGLAQAQAAYDGYVRKIAGNILNNREDTEECASDAFFRLWQAIPPARPVSLMAFLAKLTRNEALKALEKRQAEKRGGGQAEEALSELENVLSDEENGDFADRIALTETLNGFLAQLKQTDRIIFIRRYWYFDEVKEIASRLHLTQSRVKVSLYRSRERLRDVLMKEQYL